MKQAHFTTSSNPNHFFPQESQLTMSKVCDALSAHFMDNHAKLAQYRLEHIEHIILYKNGYLTLLTRNKDNNYKEEQSFATAALQERYKLVKAISHLSVSIVEMVNMYLEKKIGRDKLMDLLRSLSKDASNIHSFLDKKNKTIDQKSLQLTREFLSKVLNCQADFPTDEALLCSLKNYLGKIKGLNEQHAKEAAALQLNSLRDIMQKWLNMESFHLNTSRILIVGTHGPRKNLIEMQFFKKLLSDNQLTSKADDLLVYIEMLPRQISKVTTDEIIHDFLAPHEANKKVADSLLSDERAMFKDVLAPYGKEVLQKMLLEHSGKRECPFYRRS
ncbi:hypothetical protein [Legionella israelensis]|nr:hypothetical protein [Legionella israelensis]